LGGSTFGIRKRWRCKKMRIGRGEIQEKQDKEEWQKMEEERRQGKM
jgi:hypothetical protein